MALLSDDETARLRELLAGELSADVTLVHYTRRGVAAADGEPGVGECASCADTEALLGELCATSEHLKLEVHDVDAEPDLARGAGIELVPAVVLKGSGARGAVRLFGLPSGYEFASLLGDVIDVAAARDELSAETHAVLDALPRDVHLQVFVTPT
jgi:alkyl hydroperoxide reductase subunit AhpF